VWEDEWSWKPRPVLASDFYVGDETLSSFENADDAMVTRNWSAGELFRKIENEKQAVAMGYNLDAVKNTIMGSGNASAMQAYGKVWDRWEQAFKNGDLYMAQTQTKQIPLATLFVCEMDGSISQMTVPQMPGSGVLNGGSGNVEFLYYSQSKYENWEQVICTFPFDIGADGTYHSVRGMGTDIFAYCDLLNKINNNLADLIVTGIRPMYQPTVGGDIEKFQLVKFGNGNLIPNGFNQLPSTIGNSLNPALEISREFRSQLSQKTAGYDQADLSQPTVEETARGS